MRTAALLFCAAAAFAATAAAPRPMPSFTVERPGGPPLKIENYRGKVVVLALIDTNCSHCQELTRELVPLSKEYAAKGVQFVECAFNGEAPTAVSGFAQQFATPFPVGYASRAAVDALLQRSIMDTRPLYVPHLMVISKKGMIQGDYAGESDFMKNPVQNIRAELDKMLGSARPATSATRKAQRYKK